MSKLKPRRSRRVEPLKDSDCDHEIHLLDHSSPVPRKLSPEEETLRRSISGPSLTAEPPSSRQSSALENTVLSGGAESGFQSTGDSGNIGGRVLPTLEVEQPTPIPGDLHRDSSKRVTKPCHKAPETAIDILYENQRGGFLCGMPLFASKALGSLDPPPWTNFAHKPSPTDIKTAQVPDPSWEWAWPEWKINHDQGVDEEGWEYSFAFSKKFSWHGPKWWNSFVRRRAWIRKRVKKSSGYVQEDPSMLNAEYFAVRPASAATSPARSPSRADSRRTSRVSISNSQAADFDELERPDIEDIETLMRALRASRIDREKIEAIDNYLAHAKDNLGSLDEEMHEIMSLFVFQASRRILLTRLAQIHEQTLKMIDEGDDLELRRKADNLTAAIKHADEEVKRLEYWSDVKGMVVEGESKGATDHGQGWDETWEGVDNSGPAKPRAPGDGPV